MKLEMFEKKLNKHSNHAQAHTIKNKLASFSATFEAFLLLI